MSTRTVNLIGQLRRHFVYGLLFCLALASTPAGALAAVDEQTVTPSLKRIEELFGVAGLTDTRVVWPVAGPYRISSSYGVRRHPIKRKPVFHHGLDIAAVSGTPIVAVAVGRVVFAGWRSGYGRVVEIEHGRGWLSRYAHAKSLTVSKGQLVLAGQMIGRVGRSGHATGAHLHLEIEASGRRIDPMAFWAEVSVSSSQ